MADCVSMLGVLPSRNINSKSVEPDNLSSGVVGVAVVDVVVGEADGAADGVAVAGHRVAVQVVEGCGAAKPVNIVKRPDRTLHTRAC